MITEAVAALADGTIVGMPTDTVYGLAVDPQMPDAVAELYDLKGRPAGKPVGILVASVDQARSMVDLPRWAVALADRHWPGALTLVARPLVVLPDWVGNAQTGTVGVRVPDHPVAQELLATAGPLAVTSANLSGGDECQDDVSARAVFGDAVAVYLAGRCPGGQASTVVDATGATPVVLRPGPVAVAG